MKYLSVLILLIISASAFLYEIGNYSEIFIDESRDNRDIEVDIFYPVTFMLMKNELKRRVL